MFRKESCDWECVLGCWGLMETEGRLIAGSRNRNEFVLINANEFGRVSGLLKISSVALELVFQLHMYILEQLNMYMA